MDGTISIAKTKALISCLVNGQLICVFVFSSPVQSTGRAIVVTLASALPLALPLRHF